MDRQFEVSRGPYRYARLRRTGQRQHTARKSGISVENRPRLGAYAEATQVFGLFGDDYDSGANGNTHLPAESDPPSKEISSLWLAYANADVQARIGRQYVNLDNQRFFTSGLWRQNPQSFDALATLWHATESTTLRYLYLDASLAWLLSSRWNIEVDYAATASPNRKAGCGRCWNIATARSVAAEPSTRTMRHWPAVDATAGALPSVSAGDQPPPRARISPTLACNSRSRRPSSVRCACSASVCDVTTSR